MCGDDFAPFEAVAVPSALGVTVRCVHTQSFSKKAPRPDWNLPISNHVPDSS